MTTFKVKLRPAARPAQKGTICYQVTHRRQTRTYPTAYTVYNHEWDARNGVPLLPPAGRRLKALRQIHDAIGRELRLLRQTTATLAASSAPFTADDILTAFSHHLKGGSLFCFMTAEIARLRQLGRLRTAETYQSSLNSLARFMKHRKIDAERIDAELMQAYETFLKRRGLSANTTSFYFRTLRAVYNRAVEAGLTTQKRPFRRVYTGIAKTVKRAAPLSVVRRIKSTNLAHNPDLQLARDLFLFSFYTRGMAFVDMAYLRKCDLRNGTLTYRRRKTNQELKVKWERCMQTIVERCNTPQQSPYLLPIICRTGVDDRRQYRYGLTMVNRRLKLLAAIVGYNAPLTMHVARHSWASIARSRNIPIAVISEGMGHDSETTTRIYLTSLDTSVVDRANRTVLEAL